MSIPRATPPAVAARSSQTMAPKTRLAASADRSGPRLVASLSPVTMRSAAAAASSDPAPATRARDCARSRAGEIACFQSDNPASGPSFMLTVIYNQTWHSLHHSTTAGAVLHLARIAAEGTRGGRFGRRSMQSRLVTLALAAAALGSMAGCGNTYRPVVTAINPVGPAAQPQKYAVVISDPGNNLPGLVTIVDFSGDTVLITANVGVAPYYFVLNAGGNTGYTLNGDGTMNSFDVSNQLQTRDVLQTTLLNGAHPNSVFADSLSTYVTEPGRSAVSQLKGAPPSLNQELPITTGFTPVYVAGYPGAARQYVINQSTSGGAGQVAAIETSSNTVSSTIAVGKNPVYGVMTSDGK